MEAAGFRVQGETVRISEDADLRPATAVLARLRRLAENRGHSGDAEFFPLPGSQKATGSNSPFMVGCCSTLCSVCLLMEFQKHSRSAMYAMAE